MALENEEISNGNHDEASVDNSPAVSTRPPSMASGRPPPSKSLITRAASRLTNNLSILIGLLHIFAPFTLLPYWYFRTTLLNLTQKLSLLSLHQFVIRTVPWFKRATLFGYPVDSWWNWLHHAPHWKACLSYLQLSVESESETAWGDDLENVGNRNIMVAMFPHGILSVSHAIAHLSGELARVGNSDRSGRTCEKVHIVTRLATLQSNFIIPGFRELLLANGVVPVSANAIRAALDTDAPRSKGGVPTKTCLLLVPGGAAESAFVPADRPVAPGIQRTSSFSDSGGRLGASSPGTNTQSSSPIQLLLPKRQGFIRLALQSGAALVACFSFGELELYRSPASSWYNRFADRFKSWTGVRPTIGVGWGGLPFLFPDTSHPVVLILSKPIPLPKIENPSESEVKYWHAKFTEELRGVYERHRGRFWGYGDLRELDLVGWESEIPRKETASEPSLASNEQ